MSHGRRPVRPLDLSSCSRSSREYQNHFKWQKSRCENPTLSHSICRVPGTSGRVSPSLPQSGQDEKPEGCCGHCILNHLINEVFLHSQDSLGCKMLKTAVSQTVNFSSIDLEPSSCFHTKILGIRSLTLKAVGSRQPLLFLLLITSLSKYRKTLEMGCLVSPVAAWGKVLYHSVHDMQNLAEFE